MSKNTKNILFVSNDGFIGDIAWQTKKEGNNVKLFIGSKCQSDVADGFVDKTDDWKKEIDWADLVVFDDVLGHGTEAESLREKGKLVVGGTNYTDKLEDDRSFGQEELKKYGISIVPYKEFKSFQEAIDFVKFNPGKYVIKPSGEAQNMKELLFVGKDSNGEDVISVLEHYKQNIQEKIEVFQLQKSVEGVEVGIGAFYNGKKFVFPININFEHKRLFPGDLGPNTGEMGTSMFWTDSSILFDRTLKKLEKKLSLEGYVGYIDLNCIVDEENIYPLEFTSRFGYPTISIQQEGIKTGIGEFLYRLAEGTLEYIELKGKYQVGIRVVVPPFPYVDDDIFEIKSKGSVISFSEEDLQGIHIEDVKKSNNDWVITGTTGLALIICASGSTMEEAIEEAYFRVKKIMITEMYYRNDIGLRWKSDKIKLEKWGYLDENRY
jgi:phosphoribosylamine---glycine ligase